MTEIDYIKARLDLLKTVINGLFLTMFGLAAYNIQSSGANFIVVMIALVFFGIFGIYLGRMWYELVNELKEPGKQKMTQVEKMELDNEKIDLNENICPLSVENWIKILSDEIDTLGNKMVKDSSYFWPTIAILIAVGTAIISWMLKIPQMDAPLVTKVNLFGDISILIVATIFVFLFLILMFLNTRRSNMRDKKKVEKLREIREEIISGKLIDSNKIREEWRKVVHSDNPIFISSFLRRD